MKGREKMAKNKLSIYMLKQGICEPEEIFQEKLNVRELWTLDDGSKVYYVPSNVHKPTWLGEFFHKDANNLFQANSKVVLIKSVSINGNQYNFAITFGYARFMFNDDVLEEQFGLKIVLNSIQQDQIRRISKASVGSNHKRSDEQLPKSSSISEFGFDINRDLMKNVSGKSNDEMFENSMLTGGDIFSLTVERDIDDIEELLIYCWNKYCDTSYRDRFAWIDNIKFVKEKGLIEQLQQKLIGEINARNYESVWMAVPEVVNWEIIKEFKISGDDVTHADIYIGDVIASLKNPLTSVSQLQSKKIYAVSSIDETNNAYEWTALKCIIAEIELEEQQYCFSDGKWYKINSDFVTLIDNNYANIELCTDDFAPYEGGSEDEYNDALNSYLTNSHLLHKYKIALGGGQGNNIEPCDLLWNNKMIHVKKNSGSSVLSHLFNQALVAGEMWIDSSCRSQIREKMIAAGEDDCIPTTFRTSDYEIIVAIINKFHNTRPKIPFFSKVAICFTATNIRNLGYSFKLKNIDA